MPTDRDPTLQRRLAQGAVALGLLVLVLQALSAWRGAAALAALEGAPGIAALGPGVVRLTRALVVLCLLEVALGAAMALAGLRLLRRGSGTGAVLLTAYGLQLLVFVVPLFFERAELSSVRGLVLSGAELEGAAQAAFRAALTGRVLGLCTLPLVLLGHRLRRVSH